MALSRRGFLRLSGAVAAGSALTWSGARVVRASPSITASDPALHVLKRLTWGINPAGIERINALGIEPYIDWQLSPDTIPDPMVDEFIAARRILSMPLSELQQIAGDQYERILNTMLHARLYRAIYSERQLYEVMVEFWTDHFNVPIGDLLAEKVVDDRETIRPHTLGSFRDLLYASARSVAMLHYLDNASSSKEHPNENYAREIMELHTLGVDGGYTEQDVIEVARAFTGWTVREGQGFIFSREMHDDGEKSVLGYKLPAGRGIEDGLDVINILTNHPSTARFIAFKLARKFISDFPPDSIVESTAQVFAQTQGDIRATLRHLLTSAEFMASAGQKFRRPLEFIVAMIRALTPGAQIENAIPLIWSLEPMGHIPFTWHPPNGFPDVAGAWMNTNGLLHRWNAALNMALAGEGYFEGIALNLEAVVPMQDTAAQLVDAAAERLLGGIIHDEDRAQLIAFVGDNTYYDTLPGVLGLLMASPYFQWR
jgi:uncharacterized protein (DUF1800 family)